MLEGFAEFGGVASEDDVEEGVLLDSLVTESGDVRGCSVRREKSRLTGLLSR